MRQVSPLKAAFVYNLFGGMRMEEYIFCRACGYVMLKSHFNGRCPACGIPGEALFEPYTKNMKPGRRFLLEQHIHPIAVHFPQVLILFVTFLPILALALSGPLREELQVVAHLSIFVLPITVLGGIVTGLLDGQLRFKRLTTPLLVRKILASIFLQVLSLVILGIYLVDGFSGSTVWLIAGLGAIGIGCSIFLGRTGSTMFNSFLPN
jgi:hypothetical protein